MAELTTEAAKPTPESARQGLAAMTQHFVTDGPELHIVRDLLHKSVRDEIPLRYYQAEETCPKSVLVFVHGGGHMAGSIEVYEPICRRLAAATKQAVLAIEYRLAPEHPWPSGLNDLQTIRAALPDLLVEFGLPADLPIHLMGDSGGGAMAATLCLQSSEADLPKIEKLVLLYPSLDYRMDTESVRLFAEGYLLTAERMRWYFEQYLQGRAEPASISPLNMVVPHDFPEVLIINAGFDPLRDEAVSFWQKLNEAGHSARLSTYADMLHAYLNLERMVPEACAETYQQIAGFLAD
ncbi:hypothetical protein BTE48_04380 [Oceanospirillum multiglobuliferum]|uniref:Alpha/beta hydrolase fold-3 domain-containing protein n=2 Tax=Oceanospirillum multiglobuliferum TaxID=64969 RepID=A0A1V4T723_9GAMM|nr:hypothetical protein BTE48_04380 [Oceanospirillum multiglobuliferum]